MVWGLNAWFLASLAMGAVWWVAIAGHPSWRRLSPRAGAQAYVASWSRGGPVLAVLAAAAAGLGFAAAVVQADLKWAVGAALMLGAIGYTFTSFGRIGHRLRDIAADGGSDPGLDVEAAALLALWGRRHWARVALVTAAVLFFIWAAH